MLNPGGEPMQLGAVFPTTEIGRDPGAIREFASGVEELGFDHLVAYDHVLGAQRSNRARRLDGPYDDSVEFHEPFVLFGHLAGVTERLGLVIGVLVAPQRQTALVAKQAAEVEMLSRGRLRLALGTGWNWVEYESLGADFERRGSVLDEQVTVLRRLWSEPVVTFDGEFHRIDRAGIRPLPDRSIPLWFGGYADVALRRTAAMGDGHLFGHLHTEIVGRARRLRELVAEAGRPSTDVGVEAIVDTGDDPEEFIRAATEWCDVGGTHLSLRTMAAAGSSGTVHRDVDSHLRTLERHLHVLRENGLAETAR
jgi:probable F420-dependent oxidoreductase